MRKPLVAGNWKMNKVLTESRALISGILDGLGEASGVEVLVFPPVYLLFPMAKAIANTPIGMGAQTAHEDDTGAFTGELSAAMIKDTGATHVIIGHSERRHVYGEQNALLAKKVRAVVKHGLTVIYCVGETLSERDADETNAVLDRQLSEVLGSDIPAEQLVVAYEPVWAIGTGRTATPEQAQDAHAFIRSRLAAVCDQATADKVRILYGGSVKPGNAGGLVSKPDIDGALVGGASLVAEDFVAIINAAAGVTTAA